MSLPSGDLRRIFGKFTTGVTVMSIADGQGRAHGVTVNSFTSVSLEPPLILWCLRREASICPLFMDQDRFAVNILGQEHRSLSDRQASRANQHLSEDSYRLQESVPVLKDIQASLICRTQSRMDGGDHIIFLAQVETADCRDSGAPLVFYDGQYRALDLSGSD